MSLLPGRKALIEYGLAVKRPRPDPNRVFEKCLGSGVNAVSVHVVTSLKGRFRFKGVCKRMSATFAFHVPLETEELSFWVNSLRYGES